MDTKEKRLESGRAASRGLVGFLTLAGIVAILALGGRALLGMHQERKALRQEAEQLRAENERLSNVVTQAVPAGHKRTAPLSAPHSRPATPSADFPIDNPPPVTDLIARIIEGEEPQLTAEQAEAYLKPSRRSAASLLAAFRGTRDEKFLQEALQKFPNDPQVNFAAAIRRDMSPEERRQRLDAFKQSA